MSFFARRNQQADDDAANESTDMFPDEYTIQKHIANAWAGEPIAQSKSVEVLATLSQQEKFQTDLISHGALDPLLSLIRSTQTNSTILRNCAQAVASLAEHPANRARIEADGGLDKLLQLVTVSDADDEVSQLRLPAITGICNLVQNDDIKEKLVSGGGVPYVLGMVKESNHALDVQRKAAEALATITSRTDLLGKMIKHGMIRNLCWMLSKDDSVMCKWGSVCAANTLKKEAWVGKFVQEECLAPLIQICKDSSDPSGDETTQLHCCEALKYVTAVRMYQGRIREAGLISPLVVLTMKSDNERVQQYALETMKNLLGSGQGAGDEDLTALMNLDVALLVLLMSQGPTEFVARTAAALANLADDEAKQEEIMAADGLEHLIYLASRPNRLGTKMINLAKEHATRALANLAMNDLAIDEMEIKGGVEPVMELVAHKDLKLVTEAVRGLANMTMNVAIRRRVMSAPDVLTKLISFMGNNDDAQHELKRCACAATQNLSEDNESLQLLVDSGILIHLVNNSCNDDNDIHSAAITSLYNVMMTIGLQPLLSVVRDRSEEFELLAAQAVMQLCFNDQTRFQIVKQGGLRLLYTLSESRDISDQLALAKNMNTLAENDSNKIRMVLEGGLKAIAPLSAAQDPEVVVESAMALRHLCFKEQLKSTIVRGDGLSLCCNFANSDNPEVHLYASQAFEFLSTRPDVQFAIMQSTKSIHALFLLATSPDREVQEAAVNAIANVSNNKDCHRLIAEGDTLRKLIKLTRSRNVVCQKQAAYAINNIATVPENRVHVANELGLDPLISMTRFDDRTVQIFGALALAELCLNEDNAVYVVKAGGLDPVIKMASAADVEVKMAGVKALSNLARFEQNKVRIGERQGLNPLMAVARDPKSGELRSAAAMAVGFLSAENEELHVLADEVTHVKSDLAASGTRIDSLENELDTSEADKYALAGEIDKLRNKLFDVMRQSAIRKMKGIVSEWKRRMKQIAFDMFSEAVRYAVTEREKDELRKEIAELGEQLEEQKASWAEYVNSNTNQVDAVYKQQAALKICSVSKQITTQRSCAAFYWWKAICTDKKYFADATNAGHNKTLHAELARLKALLADETDDRQRKKLSKSISDLQRIISQDSSMKKSDNIQGMEHELHESREREQKYEMEMEMIKDKLKKQACVQIMKQMQDVFSKKGAAGYFLHWKGVWVHQKNKTDMDADEPAGDGSGVASGVGARKISKLQWLVQEMQGERDDMWREMNSLMGTLRQFETEKTQLITQLTELQGEQGKLTEECMLVRRDCEGLSQKVDQTVEGR